MSNFSRPSLTNSRRRSVFAIFPGPDRQTGACELYRITMPYWYLAQMGKWQVGWAFAESLLKSPEFARVVARTEIFVFPRMIAPDRKTLKQIGKLFDYLRQLGKVVVYEVDDDYTNEFRYVAPGDAVSVMRLADVLTVSTALLGQRLKERVGKDYYVLPNCLDPAVWRANPRETSGPVHIILSGSASHIEDWKVLRTVLPRILERFRNVRLSIAGFIPDYLAGLPHTTYYGPAPYLHYAHLIRTGDIVLAPVIPDDGFNLGKSAIKAIEGMGAARIKNGEIVGGAVIATNMPVYSKAIQHERNGLLVEHTPEAWETALARLIEDEELRYTLQRRGFKYAWSHFNIAEQWREWDKAYRDILTRF